MQRRGGTEQRSWPGVWRKLWMKMWWEEGWGGREIHWREWARCGRSGKGRTLRSWVINHGLCLRICMKFSLRRFCNYSRFLVFFLSHTWAQIANKNIWMINWFLFDDRQAANMWAGGNEPRICTSLHNGWRRTRTEGIAATFIMKSGPAKCPMEEV